MLNKQCTARQTKNDNTENLGMFFVVMEKKNEHIQPLNLLQNNDEQKIYQIQKTKHR